MTIRDNLLNYKILSLNGWQPFTGIKKNNSSEMVRFHLESGEIIEATPDHYIFYNENKCKQAKEYKEGDKVCSSVGYPRIIKICYIKRNFDSYDVLEVGKDNKFYANNVLVHNCEFIGQSNALIDSAILRNMLEQTKARTYNFVIDSDIRFYKNLDKNRRYVIGVDPSMGVGGDFAAIQVFEFPTFEQVAEWQSDKLNQNEQVEKLKALVVWMYTDLKAKGCISPEIYWSFENNAVGEGFLCSLREKAYASGDGDAPSYISHGICISQIGNKRIGFTTDKRTKNMACAQLKNLIEKNIMTINSKEYAKELSTFTLKNVNTYASQKSGEHDDLISASLIVIDIYIQSKATLDLDHEILSLEEQMKYDESFDLPFIYSLK